MSVKKAENAIKELGEIIGELERWETRHESVGGIVRQKSTKARATLIELMGNLFGIQGVKEVIGNGE